MGQEQSLPRHVAIIMDGNGRWAKARHLPRVLGHNAVMTAMKEIVRKASNMGIAYLTVFAFSTENWKRSAEEVGGIFDLLVKFVASDLAELDKENVRVRVLGDYSVIPDRARESLERTIRVTAGNTGMQFNIALNYGARAEVIRAVNTILAERIDDLLAGLSVCDIGPGDTVSMEIPPVTEEEFSQYLYTGNENGNVPDPDLIIRTSGEERLSNFLLWQGAYSELAFTDSLWPDFTPEEFERIVTSFGTRERRFGGRKEEDASEGEAE